MAHKNWKSYLTEEMQKATQDTANGSCKWGITKAAKPTDKFCETDGHVHNFVVDEFGYGRTSEANDNGYTHWHQIFAGKVQVEGNHYHELGPVKGTCSSFALFDGYVPEIEIGHTKKG